MPSSPRSSPRCNAKPRRAERALWAGLAALLLVAGAARAYVRIVIDGTPLAWSSPQLTWNLHTGGSEDVADGSHAVAVERAFRAWDSVSGTQIRFTRGPDLAEGPDGAGHVVMFDESNETGYFPAGTGIVALTPIEYELGSGRILDADVVFNARDYSWSTDGTPGTFDVQDVLTHEVGHFVGLDHSPGLGATMWPYVSFNQWLHRSLTLDDRSGVIAVAETGAATRMNGVVRRGGVGVSGAMVCAVNAMDGRLACSVLSAADGSWVMKGLPVGSYLVYASPLEGAMSAANLTGDGAVSTAFAAAFYGGFSAPTLFTIGPGANVACGNLAVPVDRALTEVTASPILLRRGQTGWVTVFGAGFTAGGMDFLVKSPHLAVSSVSSAAGWARALVTVSSNAPWGSYDAYVRDPGGVLEIATGAVEVIAEAPALAGVSAPMGDAGGGEIFTLTGAHFQAGCYVLFGGVEAAAVEFVDAGTLLVTTPAAPPGPSPIAVHNPDGQQDQLEGAFSFTAPPEFRDVFPRAGQAAGGTLLRIRGGALAPDVQVEIDGQALVVNWRSAQLVEVLAPAHAAGRVDLLLRNPGQPDLVAPQAYRYVDGADPSIRFFTPDRGPKSGGTRVGIEGDHLEDVVAVRFGVDPITGLGGVRAEAVQARGSARVDATTAAQPSAGVYGVTVETADGRAALAGGFTFEGSGSSNPGGTGFDLPAGGCAGNLGGRASDPRGAAGDAALAGAWALAFLLLRRRTRRADEARAPQR